VTAAAAELSRVTKRFGARVALDDISFSIGEGEVVALLGPKGVVRLLPLGWLWASAQNERACPAPHPGQAVPNYNLHHSVRRVVLQWAERPIPMGRSAYYN
jgi:hypothetical protein